MTAQAPWSAPAHGPHSLLPGSALLSSAPSNRQSLVHPGVSVMPPSAGPVGVGGLHVQFCDGPLCTACPAPSHCFLGEMMGRREKGKPRASPADMGDEGRASPETRGGGQAQGAQMHRPFSSFASQEAPGPSDEGTRDSCWRPTDSARGWELASRGGWDGAFLRTLSSKPSGTCFPAQRLLHGDPPLLQLPLLFLHLLQLPLDDLWATHSECEGEGGHTPLWGGQCGGGGVDTVRGRERGGHTLLGGGGHCEGEGEDSVGGGEDTVRGRGGQCEGRGGH